MQRPRQELVDIWAELHRRDPVFFEGHASRLQVLCAKWQGSNEELTAFTRAAAPAGSPIPALLVAMHIELASDQEISPIRYFGQEPVRAELRSDLGRRTPNRVDVTSEKRKVDGPTPPPPTSLIS